MDVITVTVKRQNALVYLGVVVVFLQTLWEHIEQVEAVLRLTESSRFTLTLNKYFILIDAINCLGHEIRLGTLTVVSKKTYALRGLKLSINISTPSSLLRSRGTYQQFVPNVSRTIIFPSAQKNGQKKKLKLDEASLTVVKQHNEKLTKPPILTLPKPERILTIHTDACNIWAGRVLKKNSSTELWEQSDTGLGLQITQNTCTTPLDANFWQWCEKYC